VFGMGTGVAPPLSPPEFSVCPAAGSTPKRGLFSFRAGHALPGLFAKQVPANKATASKSLRQPRMPRAASAHKKGRCPLYQVPGRGSGHSEHRPKPARTEVSPSARPQPGNYGCRHALLRLFSYHDNCFEGIDPRASLRPSCITGLPPKWQPAQLMIALVKPLGLLVLLG
jgi:hypothetical protein